MELDGSTRGAYRLVVGFGEREVIFDTQPLSDYKGAVAHVAAAVRRHARDGRVVGVALQRCVSAAPIADNTDPGLLGLGAARRAGQWTTLEHWGTEVIERIVTQSGGQASGQDARRAACHRLRRAALQRGTPPSSPTSPASPAPARPDRPARSPGPKMDEPAGGGRRVSDACDPAGRNAARRLTRAGSHRWHLVVTVAVVAVAWLGVAFVMAGGQLDRLLGGIESARPAIATELPFDGPKAAQSPPQPPALGEPLTRGADDGPRPVLTASPARPR